MKYWEFLIQKEGDETWLPLETQQVEILEGRYRVVAHTDRVNTPMEIRVSQLMTEEMPPRKRVRKRQGETNDAGLVVVMPYVHLKPGQWEVTCSSLNLMDDFMGEGWRYQVQLQVFPPTEEDWSSEWPVPNDAATLQTGGQNGGPSGVQSTLIENPAGADAIATQEDAPLIQAQAQLKDNLQRQGHVPDAADTPIDLSYRISLQQQAFLARRNQSMTITGQVQALVDAPQMQGASQLWLRLQNPETAQVIMEAHRPLSLDRLPADFKVKIQLPTNVRTRVVLGEVSLRSASVDGNEPAKILSSTAFTITAGIALLLDDIANRDLGEFEEEVSVVFGEADDAIAPTHSSEPNLVSPVLDPTHKNVVPAVGVVLPPKLDRNGHLPAEPAYSEPPELPSFPAAKTPPLIVSDAPAANRDIAGDASFEDTQTVTDTNQPPNESLSMPAADASRSRQPMVAQPAQFMGTSIEDDDLETSQIAALLEDIDGDLASQAPTMGDLEPPGVEGSLPESRTPHQRDRSHTRSAQTERTLLQPSAQDDDEATAEPPVLLTRAEQQRQARIQRQAEANVAFKSLKLKDHFWQRLSNLNRESHQEASQLSQNMKAAGVSPTASRSIEPAVPGISQPFQPTQPDEFSPNSEVVIYDDSPAAAPATDVRVNTPEESAALPIVASPDSLTPASFDSPAFDASKNRENPSAATNGVFSRSVPDEELPEMALPVISVPVGDLVAGDMVTITVRSQPSLYKPFIKLWMIDRQSRTLVGEPKLLTNLKPDALGYLETSADLRVPMGCLDVQIAAIAVDMATQQESNKAIVNRHVVPSRQSPSGLRNF